MTGAIQGRRTGWWLEVICVIATGLLHFPARALDLQGLYILAALLLWLSYVGWCVRRDRRLLAVWGFRLGGLWPTVRRLTLVAIPVVAGMAVFARSQGQLQFPAHTLVLLALYPLWGLVQQFLVQALVVGNLEKTSLRTRRWIIVLLGAGLFGVVHAPIWPLVAATFGMGLLFVPIYLRYRNLWPLAFFHGWLGTLFYLWMLGVNPWSDLQPG